MWIFKRIQCCWIYMTRVLEESKTCFKSFQLITALFFKCYSYHLQWRWHGVAKWYTLEKQSHPSLRWEEYYILVWSSLMHILSAEYVNITKHERVLFNFWKSENPLPVVSTPLFLVGFMFFCHLFYMGYATNDSLTTRR